METVRFLEMLRRNSWKPDWKCIKTRWGARAGVPAVNATIIRGNEAEGWAWNIAHPYVPRETVRYRSTIVEHGRIKEIYRIRCHGWKTTLTRLVDAKVVKRTPEVQEWLRG